MIAGNRWIGARGILPPIWVGLSLVGGGGSGRKGGRGFPRVPFVSGPQQKRDGDEGRGWGGSFVSLGAGESVGGGEGEKAGWDRFFLKAPFFFSRRFLRSHRGVTKRNS